MEHLYKVLAVLALIALLAMSWFPAFMFQLAMTGTILIVAALFMWGVKLEEDKKNNK